MTESEEPVEETPTRPNAQRQASTLADDEVLPQI